MYAQQKIHCEAELFAVEHLSVLIQNTASRPTHHYNYKTAVLEHPSLVLTF